MLNTERQIYYIKSKPPTGPYLYHHSSYTGLRMIAEQHTILPDRSKYRVSLTTDAGRYLSPLPFLMAVTVDGVVRMPFTNNLKQMAIPVLYKTYKQELANEADKIGYEIFRELPKEYTYITKWVVQNDMFVNENEYVVIGEGVAIPSESEIFIDPKKIKRFVNSLSRYSIRNIYPLTELK